MPLSDADDDLLPAAAFCLLLAITPMLWLFDDYACRFFMICRLL